MADHNAAGRDIRMTKVQQKVSGCLRALTGARHFTAIRSYLATAAKHGINFFDALVCLAEGSPWLPNQPGTDSLGPYSRPVTAKLSIISKSAYTIFR